MSYIEALSPYHYKIQQGFVPHMRVPGVFYVNDRLKDLLFEELQTYCQRGEHGGFLPAVKQIANVAALPGIVKVGGGWVRGRGRRWRRSGQGGLGGVARCEMGAAPTKRACVAIHLLHLLRQHPQHILPRPAPQKSIALPDVHSGYGCDAAARQSLLQAPAQLLFAPFWAKE